MPKATQMLQLHTIANAASSVLLLLLLLFTAAAYLAGLCW
jgi:hypothetical protein